MLCTIQKLNPNQLNHTFYYYYCISIYLALKCFAGHLTSTLSITKPKLLNLVSPLILSMTKVMG